jgi:hypothetical protein
MLAAAVLALLVVPVAIAGSADDGSDPTRIATASIKKKFKAVPSPEPTRARRSPRT